MRKILTMAWKELYETYTDRSLFFIMIVTPLALATIIGLALGQFMGGDESNDVPVRDIPIVIVNLDEGNENINYGRIFIDMMVPAEEGSRAGDRDDLPVCDKIDAAESDEEPTNILFDLTDAVEMDDPVAARAAVDTGEVAAAIIIPADFTERVSISADHASIEPIVVEVYGNSASPLAVSIIANITESITNQIATGQITMAATFEVIGDLASSDPTFGMQVGAAMSSGKFQPNFSCAFDPNYAPLRLDQQTVAGKQVGSTGGFDPLVYFGAANAIFFMMFTAQAGANDLLRERQQWTLQRLLASPTPRLVVLLGKLIGTFVNCMVQLVALFLALTLIGSLMAGELKFIWGTDILSILLVMVAASIGAGGLGVLINGLVRTQEQGNVIGSTLIVLMGAMGGTFFPVQSIQGIPVVGLLPYFTLNYWGVEAFTRLAVGRGDILLNVAILIGLGAVMFGIGLWFFDRQLDI
ncbi:MAG: ABC transporter permease [Anaerolineae bacterium]|nr:ABC transporter permease [Anaerolineae bacterium]